MQKKVLVRGTASKAGNLTAYTALGEQFFVGKGLIESAGFKDAASVKFPLFAITATKDIGQLDANGEVKVDANGEPVTVKREQAVSVFATKADLTQAFIDAESLDAELNAALSKHIRAFATTANLSEDEINALANATI